MQNQNNKDYSSGFDLDYLTAQNFVASGKLEEAEDLLRQRGEQSLSIASLDLLARIAMQKGQTDQAQQLWKSVLEKEPDNEAAKSALKRLNSPWIAIALIKRIALLASIFVILSLSAVGLFTLFNGDRPLQPQSATSIDKSSQIKVTSSFAIPGCSIYSNKGETKIIFNDGLFSFCCNLKDSSRKQLAMVARFLQNNFPNHQLIIEGHADSSSMRKNNLFKDNYDLGFKRALTVAELFREQHQINADRILISSLGDKNPVFSENAADAKLKNRTVVIRISE